MAGKFALTHGTRPSNCPLSCFSSSPSARRGSGLFADCPPGCFSLYADLVRRARAHSGCLDLSISEDPVNPSRVNLMELWKSWRKRSNPPNTGIQIEEEMFRSKNICHSRLPC